MSSDGVDGRDVLSVIDTGRFILVAEIQPVYTFTCTCLVQAHGSMHPEYTKTLEEAGFQSGRATVVAFYHPERDIRIIVHGDDYVVEGKQSDLEWVRDVLATKYILKVKNILGPDLGDQKSIGEFW